jgi:hypothetical protein
MAENEPTNTTPAPQIPGQAEITALASGLQARAD